MLPKRTLLYSTVLVLLTACQGIAVKVPVVEQKDPVTIPDRRLLATIKFDRIGFKIKRGEAIGSYTPSLSVLNDCYGYGGNIFWNQGRILGRNIEFSDTFFQAMKDANFNIIGDPDKMFAQASDNARSADFLVGGQIEEIKMNVCDQKDLWTGLPRLTQKGKGAVKIRWQVFSVFERKVVFETVTEGATTLANGVSNGELLIIQDAFAAAAENLSANQEFAALLAKFEPQVASNTPAGGDVIFVPEYKIRTASITDVIEDTRLAVVTINAGGSGHGSGFFISPTLIVTNKHVVGDSDFVRVQLLTGRKIRGEVIRRHPARDVALVQVEKTGIIPLPIRQNPVKITEEVYAIGSPLLKKLSGTVSKGIVSKFLVNRRGFEDIQADVDIQGGNSGGALLDNRGNVVGITYAGYGGATSIGINLFIPIMDAFSKLNLQISNTPEGS